MSLLRRTAPTVGPIATRLTTSLARLLLLRPQHWLKLCVVVALSTFVAEQGTGLRLFVDKDGTLGVLEEENINNGSSEAPSSREFRDCGGNLSSLATVSRLYSPGYPGYEPDQHCKWIITGEGPITLRIVFAAIEETTECEFDNVEVLLGPEQISTGKMCGNLENKTIETNSTVATIIFQSDSSYEEYGFHLEFWAVIPEGQGPEKKLCANAVTVSEGNVTSPNYPDPYPGNTSCWTLISVEPGKVVVASFTVLALEHHDSCAYDYVEIFDGPSDGSPTLGRFCGDSQKRMLRATGNNVLVHFKSDAMFEKQGFVLEYRSDTSSIQVAQEGDCSVTSDSSGTVATSANYPDRYPANSSCLLTLEAPQGTRVSVRFQDFALQPDDNCTFDYVNISDRIETGWRELARLCGDAPEPRELVSTLNQLRLQFHSDDSSEYKGFRARIAIVALTEEKKSSDAETPTATTFRTVPASEIADEVPQSRLRVPEGGDKLILCVPKKAASKVVWKKDGQDVSGDMPLPDLHVVSPTTLWIRKMSSTLEGNYSCLISTGDRQANASTEVAMVGTKQHINCSVSFQTAPIDHNLSEGDTAILRCAAKAPLRPSSEVSVAWLKDGLPFPTTARHRDLANGLAYIRDLRQEDSAVYACVATDRVFNCSVTATAILRVKPKVSIQEICGSAPALRASAPKSIEEHGKIVGGKDSVKGAHPWQVMFRESGRDSFCGGSLLNDRWVLSASHCFRRNSIRMEEVRAFLGKHDQTVDEPEEIVKNVVDVHIHPHFNPRNFDNDIALVQLEDRVPFSDYVRPVCLEENNPLPQRDSSSSGSEQLLGTVIGWGQLTESPGTVPRYLHEIRLPIVDQDVCVQSTNYTVTGNMFCAGYGRDIIGDACSGDSGGPFLVERDNRWFVIGVVSWGEGCSRRGKYGFYANVTNYHQWIKRTITF